MSAAPERWLGEAQRLLQQGQPESARQCLAPALTATPQDGRVHYLMAAAWRDSGQAARALPHAERSVALLPTEAVCRYLLAQVQEDLGQVPAAIDSLRAALSLQAAYPEAHHYLGMLLADRGEDEAALASFQAALRYKPDYARAWNNYGSLLRDLGRIAEAERAFREAARRRPDYALAHHNLGLLLRDAGNKAAAIASLQRAQALPPQRAETVLALGNLLRTEGDLDTALRVLRQALPLERPREARLHLALAFCLAERGDVAQARETYHRAALRAPGNLRAALGEALTLPPIYQSGEEIELARRAYSAGLTRLQRDAGEFKAESRDDVLSALAWNNFYLAYQGLEDRPLQVAYDEFLRKMLARVAPEWLLAPEPKSDRTDKIRIGFASSFFSDSTVGHYFARWITELDPARFEVYIYHLRPGADQIAQEIAARALVFRALAGKRIGEIINTIRGDDLEVLLYPELGMDSTCFLLAAMRLAPVQCAAWGHPVTSGHLNIDFFFSSAAMEPPGAEASYCETLIRLPGIGTSYPRPPVPTLLSREALGLPRTGELLLLPQSLFKIHPDNDRLVAAILAGRPGAKLVLFTGRHESITLAYRQRLERALAEHDAGGAERLVFLPYVPRDRYLQINLACDLMLDTQHWSGGNTSLDALACALPVVTLPGRFMRGRQSAAMLEIAGVPELIVESAEAYVSLALRLLEDRDFQQTVRGRLVGGAGRLFDDPAPLRALAEFLQSAVAADRARSA